MFNKNEEQKSLYVEDTNTEPPAVDVHNLSRVQLRERLESCISGIFSESPEIATRELKQLSSLREIDERIRQLSLFLEVANQGLFLEVMDNYDQLVKGMENIESIATLLSISKNIAHSTSSALTSLEQDLILSLVYIVKKQQRLKTLKSVKESVDVICDAYKQTTVSIKQALKEGELYRALILCNNIEYIISEEDSHYPGDQKYS